MHVHWFLCMPTDFYAWSLISTHVHQLRCMYTASYACTLLHMHVHCFLCMYTGSLHKHLCAKIYFKSFYNFLIQKFYLKKIWKKILSDVSAKTKVIELFFLYPDYSEIWHDDSWDKTYFGWTANFLLRIALSLTVFEIFVFEKNFLFLNVNILKTVGDRAILSEKSSVKRNMFCLRKHHTKF